MYLLDNTYDYAHNGQKCTDLLQQKLVMTLCVDTYINDEGIADADIPSYCRALINYDQDQKTANPINNTNITGTPNTATTYATPSHWVMLCSKYTS